jgi:hypothetical protein
MTISFENDNHVIIYALEKIFFFARDKQYVFLAQRIWWISSLIGLQQGLVDYIDNSKILTNSTLQEVSQLSKAGISSAGKSVPGREVTKTSCDTEQDSRLPITQNHIDPDRLPQVAVTFHDIGGGDSCNTETEQLQKILTTTEDFLLRSGTECNALRKSADPLSWTGSGKAITKALTKKRRNYL